MTLISQSAPWPAQAPLHDWKSEVGDAWAKIWLAPSAMGMTQEPLVDGQEPSGAETTPDPAPPNVTVIVFAIRKVVLTVVALGVMTNGSHCAP